MRCAYHEADFEPKTSRRRFRSDKCQHLARQANRAYGLGRLKENLAHALAQVQAIRERREGMAHG